MKNPDECIMDVLVEPAGPGRYRLKLIAMIGGTGPDITMPRSVLEKIRDKINDALGQS